MFSQSQLLRPRYQQTYKDEKGLDVFIDQGNLKYNHGIKHKGKAIPFTNDNVLAMYKEAAISHDSLGHPKKTLLLDITDNRVFADGNVITVSPAFMTASVSKLV